jgi:hypothetical protein
VSRRRLFALVLAAALAVSAQALSGQAAEPQAMEVQESKGFVEVLLPELGWRQAVVGRQVPADSVMTSWTGATATVRYGDGVVTLEPLTHVTVVSLSGDLVRLSVESGGIAIESPIEAFEIEFRGMVVRIEKGGASPGKASLVDGSLTVQSGSVVVSGAGAKPLSVAPGTTVSLLSPPAGPAFDSRR